MYRSLRIPAWLPAMIFVTGFLLACPGLKTPTAARQSAPLNAEDNPDHFHLVATSADCKYSFTYDPLAADQWLFRTAGPQMPPAIILKHKAIRPAPGQ